MRKIALAAMLQIAMGLLLALPAHGAETKPVAPDDFAKILIFSEGEDASSNFDYLYFFDKNDRLTYVINIWNGGCCQAPLVEEFARAGDSFKLTTSYNLDEKFENIPKTMLCNSSLKRFPVEPTHDAVDGFKIETIEPYHLKEALVFTGCE